MIPENLSQAAQAFEACLALAKSLGGDEAIIQKTQEALDLLKEEISASKDDLTIAYQAGFHEGKYVSDAAMRDSMLFRVWAETLISDDPKPALAVVHAQTVEEVRNAILRIKANQTPQVTEDGKQEVPSPKD